MVRMPTHPPMTQNDSRAEERTFEATAIHEIEQGFWAQWRLELTEDVIHLSVRIPIYPKVIWKFSKPKKPRLPTNGHTPGHPGGARHDKNNNDIVSVII